MIGIAGLVVGFIIWAVILRKTQLFTRANTESIWSLKEAIEKIALDHHEVEQGICSRFDKRLENVALTSDGRFEYIKKEQKRMKEEIIAVINTSFDTFAHTFGGRLEKLEYEVESLKKEIQ